MKSYRLNEFFRHLFVLRKALLHRFYSTRNKAKQQVVFIAGVQRSGTNMMMDVLERSYETDVYHERDNRAFKNYQMRDLNVIRDLLANSHAPYFIIKALCELHDLDQLMDAMTIDSDRPAKIVWVNRHFYDVVNSMLVSFKNQSEQVKRIAKSRNNAWLSKGFSEENYKTFQTLVHEDISNASAAALIWYFRSQLFFELGFDTNPRVQLVQYEKLVTDPQTEFPRIFNFIGLDYSDRVSGKVFGSSVRRRSPPEIDAAIVDLCESLMPRFAEVVERQCAHFLDKNNE